MASADLFRLCNLITNSLRPYTGTVPILVDKGKEKDLLILLSRVSREIKRWTNEVDCNSDEEIVSKPLLDGNCLHGLEPFSGKESNCLANIVSVLVVFLTLDNQYVRHLAENVLVVISNFLIASGSEWKEFLHWLWSGLEAVISQLHVSSLASPAPGSDTLADEKLTHCYTHTNDEASGYDTKRLILFLQPRLINADWFTATGLIRVLRNTLKSLRQDYGELEEVYIRSFCYSLSNDVWVLLQEIHVGQIGGACKSFSKNALCQRNICSPGSMDIFLGALLQLLCSLVGSHGMEEAECSHLNGLPFFPKIINLVPKLLCWCLSRQGGDSQNSISQYLKHKMLVLMMRLSFQIHQERSLLVLWLQLLRKYFEDILYQPISECAAALDNSLEGSPFLASIVNGEKMHNNCSHHLQRQAFFILFKCSFSLISLSKKTGQDCACATANSCLTHEPQSRMDDCCTMALSQLSEWLDRHFALDNCLSFDDYLRKCSSFASSFLALYIDEDDFLFEMLLQLLASPLPVKPVRCNEDANILEEVKGDVLYHMSSIFNPTDLFHLFLSRIHYDHLVLLDYLISKDTGINCLQYLLRSLRVLCRSWHIFVDFSSEYESKPSHLSCKKRKAGKVMNVSDSRRKVEIASSSLQGIEDVRLTEMLNSETSGCMCKICTQGSFGKAKECLLSLKKSVENLQMKNLFPYNPAALLRSLTRFQELCQQHEEKYLKEN